MLNISPFSLSLPVSFSFKFFLSYFIFLPDVSIPINTIFIIYLVSLSLLFCFCYANLLHSLSVSFFFPSLSLDYRQFLLEWRILFLFYRDTIYLIARRESNTYMNSALCDRLLNKDKKVWHVMLFCISTTQ